MPYDGPWKLLIETIFSSLIEFLFPEIYEAIDWKKKVVFKDKELQKIAQKNTKGRLYLDKLVEVTLNNGDAQLLLIHIEFQSDPEKGFAERMYHYWAKIKEKKGKQVISLAILGDIRSNWRPNIYEYKLLGTKLCFEYPIAKLLDYENDWETLENSSNPFALAVMAHLKTKRTKGNQEERAHWKTQFIRLVLERNYRKEEIRALFEFINWVMNLSPELDNQVENELKQILGEEQMQEVTGILGIHYRKGKAEGRVEILLKLLSLKFGKIPETIVQKVEAANVDRIDAWLKASLSADSLESIFQ